jgi:hypothetical protein
LGSTRSVAQVRSALWSCISLIRSAIDFVSPWHFQQHSINEAFFLAVLV